MEEFVSRAENRPDPCGGGAIARSSGPGWPLATAERRVASWRRAARDCKLEQVGGSEGDCGTIADPGRPPLCRRPEGPANSYPVEAVRSQDHDAPAAGPLGEPGGRGQSCWRHLTASVRDGVPPTQVGFQASLPSSSVCPWICGFQQRAWRFLIRLTRCARRRAVRRFRYSARARPEACGRAPQP